MNCQNCNADFHNDDPYCSLCGQSKKDLNRPFRRLISESLFELFDIDGRLSLTIYTLLFHPGTLSSNYRSGKRVSYTPPLRMYLITSLLLFFLMALIKTDDANNQDRVSFLLLPGGLLEQIPKMMVILLPIYALFLQAIQPRSKYIFNLVFSLHIHTFWYMLFTFFLLLETLSANWSTLGLLAGVLAIYFVVYQLFAIRKFFEVSWIKTILINVFTLGLYLGALSLGLEITVALQEEF